MKRILAAALFCVLSAPAFAVCPATLQLKDNAGATPTAKYTDDGSGNCMANVALQDGADVSLGAKADAAASSDTGTFSFISLFKRALQTLTTIATNTGAAIPSGTNVVGFVTPDPCSQLAKTNVAISQATSTQIIAGTSAKKTYICSINLIAGAAEIVNLIEGTGSVCATGSAAVLGSTTAANGQSLAANGGLTSGNGLGSVAIAGSANADNVCLTQSTSSRVSGVITYVQQ